MLSHSDDPIAAFVKRRLQAQVSKPTVIVPSVASTQATMLTDQGILLTAWQKAKSVYAKLNFFTEEKLPIYNADSKQAVQQMLIDHGCLWSTDKGHQVNHFNNIFLTELRHLSTPLYQEIIYEYKGVDFFTNGTLMRRDSRPAHIIFKQGFDLWPGENTPATPKLRYLAWPNNRVGISCSDTVMPYNDIPFYYTIILPADHKLLIVKVPDSPYPEWIAMERIPPEYVYSCTYDAGQCAGGTVDINPNQQVEDPRFSEPTRRMGCY